MRFRPLLAILAAGATTLALAPPTIGSAAPDAAPTAASAERRAPGAWSKITTGEVKNIAEPGLLRTADGVLHVVYRRDTPTSSDLAFTTISPQGKVAATGTAVSGWVTLPTDPKLLSTPDGGLRLVFGGLQDTDVANPYSSGRMFSSLAPAAGTPWTLQPGSLTQSSYAYGSYGTGVTTLADGSPMVAFPLNNTLTWNVGGGPTDGSYTAPECCLYFTSLARTGDAVWSVFYANGSAEANQGVFVKQLLPAEGPVTKAPGSTSGGSSVAPTQAVPLLPRPDGRLLTAYCVGYPTCQNVSLWRVGDPAPRAVPGTRGAREYAIAQDPSGRIWVAWSTERNRVHFTRSSPAGTSFGAVTQIKPPKSATVYSIAVSAAAASADLVLGDGKAMWHRRVLPGLSLSATPKAWKRSKRQAVAVTVRDAGAPVRGAKVAGGGDSCTTAANGRCTLSYPVGKATRISLTATKPGYGAAQVRVRRR